MNILVVEDERRMAELIRKGLSEDGHTVACAYDGEEGLEMAQTSEFDAIVLDVMMPRLGGYEMAKRLRTQKVTTPILMLTAKDTVPDIVQGLDLGCDDYMTKPFSFKELLARLRAIKRRESSDRGTCLQVGNLLLDPASRDVVRGDRRISLTKTEFNLLERLMHRAGRVVSRQFLIESVWGHDREIETNTLDAFLHLLREKVDGPGEPKLIQTVRGIGYSIRPDSSA